MPAPDEPAFLLNENVAALRITADSICPYFRHVLRRFQLSLPISIGNIVTVITLHKMVFRVPKITRTARTLCEIKGVMWEYSYEGKHLEKR